jgi:hypothetical protein
MPTATTETRDDTGGPPDQGKPFGRNFNEPGVVFSICEQLMLADSTRSHNRARLAEFFNGSPPYTAEEEEALRVTININELTAVELLNVAYNRFATVFAGPVGFASIALPKELPQAEELSLEVTTAYNDLLKSRQDWMGMQVDRWRSVVLHGWGSLIFFDPLDYVPVHVACDDIKFPARTLANLTNATLFVIKRRYSLRELYEQVMDEEVASDGWNKKFLKQLIKEAFDQALIAWNQQGLLEHYQPESLTMDLLTQTGWMTADVLPTLDIYMVYYFDEKEGAWFCRGVPATMGRGGEFVYSPESSVGKKVEEVLHLQVADAGNSTPRRIHIVRGLGKGLFGVGHLYTRLFCRFAETIFENSYAMFRSGTTDSRERHQYVDLHHLAVLPRGISPVPQNERYSADLLAMLKGLEFFKNEMVQRIRSYLAHYEAGAERETATQTNAKVAAAQGIMQSQISLAMQQEATLHRQILSRLCDPGLMIRDEVREFWHRLKPKGITPILCASPNVVVSVPRSSGDGDIFTSLMEGQAIMSIRGALPAASQPLAIRKFLMSVTKDAHLTEQLQPTQPQPPPDVMRAKSDVAIASLGIMPVFDSTVNLPAYLPAFVQGISEGLQSESQEPEPDAADVEGFQKALAVAAKLLGQLAQDQQQVQLVQQLKKQIGALNKVAVEIAKGIAEARNEQGQSQQDPAMMKALNDIQLANQKAMADMERRMQEIQQQNQLFAAQLEQATAKAKHTEVDATMRVERQAQEQAQQDVLFEEQRKAAEARAKTAELGVELAQVRIESAKKQQSQIGKEKTNGSD